MARLITIGLRRKANYSREEQSTYRNLLELEILWDRLSFALRYQSTAPYAAGEDLTLIGANADALFERGLILINVISVI